jgi:CheY-like chemotaxis protein
MKTRLNIFLLEDDPDDCKLFTNALQEACTDCTLRCAMKCEEFFSRLETEEKPDIIFLDIKLPGISGHECLRQLKADSRYRDIPVMMYSGSKSIEDVEQAHNEGAHFYLVKAYATANMVETLRRVFDIDWKQKQPIPDVDEFIINTAFV